jgi:hypothetical protein
VHISTAPMAAIFSNVGEESPANAMQLTVGSSDPSCLWLLDQDIPQLEHLARLDGEFLAKLRAGFITHRAVVDPVHGARDQCRQRKLPLVGESQALRVMERVKAGDEVLVGRQLIVTGWIVAYTLRGGR